METKLEFQTELKGSEIERILTLSANGLGWKIDKEVSSYTSSHETMGLTVREYSVYIGKKSLFNGIDLYHSISTPKMDPNKTYSDMAFEVGPFVKHTELAEFVNRFHRYVSEKVNPTF